MIDNLKTCLFGGYDKMQTLKFVDKLTSEVYMLETALGNKKRGDRYIIPTETEDVRLKNAAVGGFSKTDVDMFVDDLKAKISELRGKLNG